MPMNAKLPVVGQTSLFEYFRERVHGAARARPHPVSQDTVWYLSQLLAEQGRAESESPTTLVELRQKAAESDWVEAITWWRRLGDHALVQVGFFRENLRRRRLSEAYYADMGRSAYGTVSRLLHEPAQDGGGKEPGLGGVFGEISARFETCTEVIAEVREEAREQNPTDIVRLYEEWLETGSARAAERLRQLGVVPARFGGAG